MKDDTQAIARYVALVPEARRERALTLHGLILSLFPQAAISMQYRMPTYRLGENFVAWASQKRHLALYTCSDQRIAGFRARHPEVRAGKGCLRFRDGQRLPLADLAQVVKNALAPGRAILAREKRR
ncbi:MAG: DUF1801 domain-containing protein [Betaproteobacteria bacterium]|nr:DUF1801 domain-containing protein [Betaproteobacteria bacterium]MDH5352442.1 DUF1801 domain-containing protein [Betaproteobacteria bacterium]